MIDPFGIVVVIGGLILVSAISRIRHPGQLLGIALLLWLGYAIFKDPISAADTVAGFGHKVQAFGTHLAAQMHLTIPTAKR